MILALSAKPMSIAPVERTGDDGPAIEAWFDAHFVSVHRFLCARIGPDLADDLTAEVFLVAHRRRESYDASRGDAQACLFGIAINLLRGYRRSEERRLRAYARAAHSSAPASFQGWTLDPSLAAALARLSHEDRSLLLLFAWAELTYEQLGEVLGLPVGTVRSRLSRVRAKVRSALNVDELAVVEEVAGS